MQFWNEIGSLRQFLNTQVSRNSATAAQQTGFGCFDRKSVKEFSRFAETCVQSKSCAHTGCAAILRSHIIRSGTLAMATQQQTRSLKMGTIATAATSVTEASENGCMVSRTGSRHRKFTERVSSENAITSTRIIYPTYRQTFHVLPYGLRSIYIPS